MIGIWSSGKLIFALTMISNGEVGVEDFAFVVHTIASWTVLPALGSL